MLKLLLVTMLIIAFCIAFLAIKVILKKGGRFPNTHVSGSKAMRDRGIHCVQAQDFESRHRRPGIPETTH